MVVCIIGLVIYSALDGNSKAPVKQVVGPVKVRPAKSSTPWSGTMTDHLDTTFTRNVYGNKAFPTQTSGTATFDFTSLRFTHLNTLATNLTITLVVTPSSPSTHAPSWLSGQDFHGILTPEDVYFTPRVSIVNADGVFHVTLFFNRLPTDALGPVCSGPVQNNPTLGLLVNAPDGIFALQLIAPTPPNGHCLSEVSSGHPLNGYPQTAAIRQQIAQANRRAQGTIAPVLPTTTTTPAPQHSTKKSH
jgi:hypothetical protein